ncbi:MAG: DNA/RNA non-specific endonuclease, partial [Caldilineaceae bacterium]
WPKYQQVVEAARYEMQNTPSQAEQSGGNYSFSLSPSDRVSNWSNHPGALPTITSSEAERINRIVDQYPARFQTKEDLISALASGGFNTIVVFGKNLGENAEGIDLNLGELKRLWVDMRMANYRTAQADASGLYLPISDKKGFGGGGATGSWEDPTKPKDRPIGDMPEGLYKIYKPILEALAKQSKVVKESGYDFLVDGLGRPLSVSGYLKLTPAERDRQAQLAAGGPDRLSTDEGGHLIAARFGGPADSKNLFPQNQNFNRSAYKALENIWAAALNRGESVWVKIEPIYSTPKTRRPDTVAVEYKIGHNSKDMISFNNQSRN